MGRSWGSPWWNGPRDTTCGWYALRFRSLMHAGTR
uniref:Uncharacterized protein n=1 Tax=Arundo donax TaxID=35708 RepID=A0A0A9H3E1_ARUDO